MAHSGNPEMNGFGFLWYFVLAGWDVINRPEVLAILVEKSHPISSSCGLNLGIGWQIGSFGMARNENN